MSYTINGVSLNANGWYLRPGTTPFATVQAEITSLRVPGVDGEVTGLTTYSSPYLKFTINTPADERLQILNMLFMSPSLVLRKEGDSSRQAAITLVNSEITRVFPKGEYVDVTFVVQIDGAYWRDSSSTTTDPQLLGNAVQNVGGFFPAGTAPVQDGYIRIRGAFSGLTVTDSSGAWFSYSGSITGGQYLMFSPKTGRAWRLTSDTWDPGTEVSGSIDYGGPRGVFEMWPSWSTIPGGRPMLLTVSTSTRSNAAFQFRGRAAYVV